jgi:hypothetical protein
MGCIDETGSLAADEVFIQCTRQTTDSATSPELKQNETNGKQQFIVSNTKVAVAKNPCMHPGDVRLLNAVDRPALRHMLDCIVFPATGPRPITNMCSGSDLDGDLYFVTWEPSLLPTKIESPMNYRSPQSKQIDRDVSIDDVQRFFVEFIENDQLGRIANAHVAIADNSPQGVKDPRCIELAKLFSLAVDFPKTGIVAQLKPEHVKDLRYPDFMEKRFDAYESQKVIGIMYRQCKGIFLNSNFNMTQNDSIEVNRSFLYRGYEAFLDEAREIYLKYRSEIERIMSLFGVKHESELLVGIYMSSTHNEEAKDFYKLSSMMLRKLWKYMRTNYFFKRPSSLIDDEVKVYCLQKASAWYFVSYTSELNRKLKILSFPWMLEDVFITSAANTGLTKSFQIRNYDIFAESLLKKFITDSQNLQFMSRFIEKLELKDSLSELSGQNLMLTGAYGLFLFENRITDFQLSFLNSNASIADLKRVRVRLQNERFRNLNLVNDVLICKHDEDVAFSLSVDSAAAIQRFLFIREVLIRNAYLMPVVYAIVHMARQDDLFTVLNTDKIKLDAFLIFCLDYFQSNLLNF